MPEPRSMSEVAVDVLEQPAAGRGGEDGHRRADAGGDGGVLAGHERARGRSGQGRRESLRRVQGGGHAVSVRRLRPCRPMPIGDAVHAAAA